MEPMKNGLAEPAIQRISQTFSSIFDFDQAKFEQLAKSGLEPLELKARLMHLIKALHVCLPDDFEKTAILLAQVPKVWAELDEQYQRNALSGFSAWPIIDYVSVYGTEHPETSLNLLKKLTPLFSAEFAIRPFIQQYPQLCLSYFETWVKDTNEHVRRLVSEGTRPLLPWGIRLTQFVIDPSPNLALLDTLKNDPSLYVRRSVANHLNDIAKHDPELVIKICMEWQQNADEKTLWLIKHACRGLIKVGHPKVFTLFGYTESPELTFSELRLTSPVVNQGGYLTFEFDVQSNANSLQQLVIDYKIYFMRANGQHNAKVFKLKNLSLPAQQCVKLNKTHSFKPITTRKYYLGRHQLEIMVNGKSVKIINFELV